MPTASPSPQSAEAGASPSASAPSAGESPPIEPVTASCQLKGADATVTLTENADDLVVTFAGEPIVSSGTTGFSVMVYDEAGEGGQLGAQYDGGNLITYFMAVEPSQTNLSGEPDVRSDVLTMTFPKDQGGLDDLDIAKWGAAYTLSGVDVGLCPGDYLTQPFPGG